MVQEAVTDLSPHVVGLLVAHPNALRTALAVAADALREKGADKGVAVIEGAEPRLVDGSRRRHRIAKRTRTGPKEDLLTSTQFAALAGLKTRQSVHDWLRKGRIIGCRVPSAAMSFRSPSATSAGSLSRGWIASPRSLKMAMRRGVGLRRRSPLSTERNRLPCFARGKPPSLRLPLKGAYKATLREWRLRPRAHSTADACGPDQADVPGDSRESPRPAADAGSAPAGSATPLGPSPCFTRPKRCGAASGRLSFVTA